MKFLGVIAFLFLMLALALASYFLWLNLPVGETNSGEYLQNLDYGTPGQSQFYQNMRYRGSEISYFIEGLCSDKKRQDSVGAFDYLEENTVLRFTQVENAEDSEILILCSEIEPKAEEAGHFVAGEGGPSAVVNATQFNVIFTGRVSLFREDLCDKPQVALHEILHSLGFDHNNNSQSIMFPVTNCKQTLDEEIISEINSLYGTPEFSDLVVEKVSASKTGAYLDFEVVVSNYGLKDSLDSKLELIVSGKTVKEFSLDIVEIGTKKILSVQNVKISRSAESVRFLVNSEEDELSKENNWADVVLG